MGLLGSLSLIVGVMVGSGIFVSPGGVLDRSGSVATAILIWALSGFVACMGEEGLRIHNWAVFNGYCGIPQSDIFDSSIINCSVNCSDIKTN